MAQRTGIWIGYATPSDRSASRLASRRSLQASPTAGCPRRSFADAGIPARLHPDMQSWLRTHAAVAVPIMIAGNMLWSLTRLGAFTRTMTVAPADEPRMLIDEMTSTRPGRTPALLAVRL
jgi:hypothetical protein